MTSSVAHVPEILRHRTWYSPPGTYAFLVNAPLSFGHSQLCVTKEESEPEDAAFARAAKHIKTCIRSFRVVLPDAVVLWNSLVRYTNTKGAYHKTLILKASAYENPTEYKIHLVPFFESHLKATNRLYQATHNKPAGKSGGLLHWIGEREVIVDYDTRDPKDPVTIARIATFRLEDLAARLRNETKDAPRKRIERTRKTRRSS